MRSYLVVFSIFLFGCDLSKEPAFGVSNELSFLTLVSKSGSVGQKYFLKVDNDQIEEYETWVLAKIDSNNKYLVLNHIVYTGQFLDAKRANASIIFYNQNGNFVGYYSVGSKVLLPSRIEKGKMYFTYKGDANCNSETVVDITNMLPKELFVTCNGEKGDLYLLTDKWE